jgi:hypothetical protein
VSWQIGRRPRRTSSSWSGSARSRPWPRALLGLVGAGRGGRCSRPGW